jgi:ligand-binding SRPBCC domain-containing protein
MTVHRIERTQLVHRSRDEVFAFVADAHNLESITPPWLQFTMLTPRGVDMREGTRLEYRLRIHGFPLRWVSRIEAWHPGRGFVDRQLQGPYRLWEHRHDLEAHKDGTLIRDRVRYALPFGLVGEVAHHLVVRGDLERIFAYRHDAVARLLG